MVYTIIHTNKGFITGWSAQFNTFDTSVTVQEFGALLFPVYQHLVQLNHLYNNLFLVFE